HVRTLAIPKRWDKLMILCSDWLSRLNPRLPTDLFHCEIQTRVENCVAERVFKYVPVRWKTNNNHEDTNNNTSNRKPKQ
ncbi:hypothetical protein S245_028341, partial [Arachis hypogaea]